GSYLSEKYRTSHWNKMYEAFTCPNSHTICLEELPEPNPNSNEATVPIMINHLGRVQHTMGSVDHAKSSNDWSKGAIMGDGGVGSPAMDKRQEGSARGMGMARGTGTVGKRQQSEAGGHQDSEESASGREPSSDVEDERPRRRRRKLWPLKKSSSMIPEEWDKSPTPPVSPK